MTTPFVIASWNIFQGLHHSSKPPRWVPNEAIDTYIAELDADVLVLPEAWRFQQQGSTWAEEIAASLGYELHQWIGKPSRPRDVVPWRMAMLTRVPATRLDDVMLPQSSRFGQRAIVRVKLDDSGLTVAGAHMYGIHLLLQQSPRSWFQERRSFRAAAADVDIIAGDMNIWGPVVRRDAGAKRSAVTGRTYPAHRPHSQIDHIMVSDRVEIIDGHVLGELGSDHRAVRATLQPA